jgi:hypothetical protein
LWEIFYASKAVSIYSFQVSPLAKLQAFTFGGLGVVSPTVFVICFVFRVMFMGGDYVYGLEEKLIHVEALCPIQCQHQFFYSKLLRSCGERKPLYWATIPLGF